MATINHSMPLPLPASGLKTNKGWWLPQVGVPAGYGQSLYPCPLLPGLHSSPYCQPAHCPTSGLPTLEPTQWPHLLDLLGAQLGDVENLLCLLQAEAREIGGSCRLVSGTSPGISCCPAGCVDIQISAQPSAAQSSPRPSMWVAQPARQHGRRDT